MMSLIENFVGIFEYDEREMPTRIKIEGDKLSYQCG